MLQKHIPGAANLVEKEVREGFQREVTLQQSYKGWQVGIAQANRWRSCSRIKAKEELMQKIWTISKQTFIEKNPM